jgi:hypothetical protein
MAIVVEDGAGLTDAVAYATVQNVLDYATARGLLFSGSTTLQEQAIVRATTYLDARYRGRFDGYPTRLRDQSLAWPRSGCYDVEGVLIASNIVPREIIAATAESAIRELATPGALAPDYERGGAVKRLKAGSVEVEYAEGASPETVMTAIDNLLAGLLPVKRPGQVTWGRIARA